MKNLVFSANLKGFALCNPIGCRGLRQRGTAGGGRIFTVSGRPAKGRRSGGFCETWLDSPCPEWYTHAVQSSKREFGFFWQDRTEFALPEKQNHGRKMDSREAAAWPRSRRGMQKLSGKRIGSGRHFGKCRPQGRTPKGQPEPGRRAAKGISQVGTEAKRPQGCFLSLFLFPVKVKEAGDSDCRVRAVGHRLPMAV